MEKTVDEQISVQIICFLIRGIETSKEGALPYLSDEESKAIHRLNEQGG